MFICLPSHLITNRWQQICSPLHLHLFIYFLFRFFFSALKWEKWWWSVDFLNFGPESLMMNSYVDVAASLYLFRNSNENIYKNIELFSSHFDSILFVWSWCGNWHLHQVLVCWSWVMTSLAICFISAENCPAATAMVVQIFTIHKKKSHVLLIYLWCFHVLSHFSANIPYDFINYYSIIFFCSLRTRKKFKHWVICFMPQWVE